LKKLLAKLQEIGDAASPDKRIIKTYHYRDEEGVVLYEVLRYEPKDFRCRRPDGHGGYVWKLDGVRRVPYQLPDLLAAPKDETCYIVEGEKDVLALRKLGLLATCNAGGAGKWPEEFSAFFKERPVAIIPDNDEPGKEHARQAARMLLRCADEVRVVELPDLPLKGDVSDWISQGHGRRDLERLAAGTPCWIDNSAANLEAKGGGGIFSPIPMRQLIKEVKREGGLKPNWLWENFLEPRSLIVLAGSPKAGKTTFVAHLVAALRKGEPFLGLKTKKTRVLWLGLEERKEEVARRFESMGAWKNLIYNPGPLKTEPQTMRALEEFIAKEQIGVVIVDTLAKFWNVLDENSAAQTDRELEPILRLARNSGASIILLHHLRKNPGSGGVNIRGSSAIFGAVDAAIVLSKKEEHSAARTLTAEGRYIRITKLKIELREGRFVTTEGKEYLSENARYLLSLLTSKRAAVVVIATKAGFTESTTRRALREILAKQPGKIVVKGGKKKGDPETYRLAGEAA